MPCSVRLAPGTNTQKLTGELLSQHHRRNSPSKRNKEKEPEFSAAKMIMLNET
jgi:hypothetical protein